MPLDKLVLMRIGDIRSQAYNRHADDAAADQRAELKALETLNEDIDQIASEAIDHSPEAKAFLDLAWWCTEDAIRDLTGDCSARCGLDKSRYCACCHHYHGLTAKARRLKAVI